MDAPALARRLRLDRPIVFFDIESTGTSPETDRIIELAVIKLKPNGELVEWTQRFNPGCPIPPETSAVHGITDSDVAGCPRFAERARAIARGLQGCDLAGHNARQFDIKMLRAEFKRAGVPFSLDGIRVVDTKAIFFQREPRDLNAAVAKYLGDAAAREHQEVAHSALGDVRATMAVLAGQLDHYADLPPTVDELHAYCATRRPDFVDDEGKFRWRFREATLAFGMNQGRSLRELAQQDPGYLRWMLEDDFSDEVKLIVSEALEGRFPAPPTAPEANNAPAVPAEV
jgi:DNA polymerase-3 subunit epsilon